MHSDMPPKNEENLWQKTVSHIVVALVAGSLTFGVSEGQSARARTIEVAKISMEVRTLHDAISQEARVRERMDEEATNAIARLSSRLDKLIDLCTQIVAQLHVKPA